MVEPIYECHDCKQPGTEFFYDKRYKHSLCRGCFLQRRQAACKAMDTEWFMSNIPFDQFTEEEKRMTGLANLEEFKKTKWETEHPDLSGGDTSSTREMRGRA